MKTELRLKNRETKGRERGLTASSTRRAADETTCERIPRLQKDSGKEKGSQRKSWQKGRRGGEEVPPSARQDKMGGDDRGEGNRGEASISSTVWRTKGGKVIEMVKNR